jgi:hypothetical protein
VGMFILYNSHVCWFYFKVLFLFLFILSCLLSAAGLDTHRVSVILLMGGIPVMRRSSISSCFDDSDNTHYLRNGTAVTRGSLPVVIVDKWEDVTKERLEAEWTRLSAVPPERWDWRRLFMQHWVDRIFAHSFKPR